MIFLHAGIFDFKSGTDIINKERTPFSGGSIFLINGILKPRNVLHWTLHCLSSQRKWMVCFVIGNHWCFWRIQ